MAENQVKAGRTRLISTVRDVRGSNRSGGSGAFVTTLDAFFLAEIGDKTQIATVGLAARFEQVCPVVLGTTRSG